ncbi:MAG TPA: alpha-ribazole phosphatase family protein [Pelobium sp.]|nr:alpha-ribazole phosphatase family protein [Pelobium sp.]
MIDRNIYLIRHPEVYNPNKLCYGQSEMPLEENFTVQFDWVKERLQLDENTTYHSSPLRRCTKLASHLSNDNHVTDQRISDFNFGTWEMKEWNEIPAKELNLWNADFVNHKVKKGECFLDLYERAIDFYEEIVARNHSENTVIITHAGIIRSVIAYVLDFPLEKVFNLRIDYSSISKVSYHHQSDLSSVAYLNLTAEHLKTREKGL